MERLWQWLERRREQREARRYGRMMVQLTLDPGALKAVQQRLAEDDWTARREGRR